ncbi:MAG: NAD(P)H-hydrate dehydratase [Anaerolineae bacterium]
MSIKVFSVAEMVAAEKAADAAGNTYEQMMEIAGRSVANAIIARTPVEGRRVLVLVGPGNNGGDGLVAGRYLAQAGADVAIYLYKSRDPEQDANFAQVKEMGLFIIEAGLDQRYRVLRTRLNITDIMIDALLGTGVSRPIGGELANLMRQAHAGIVECRRIVAEDLQSNLTSIARLDHRPPDQPIVVAVDCPSGLNCDSGALDRLAIPADLTVTFAGPKRGHFIFPGAAACGELVVADIGISDDLPEVQSASVQLATADLARSLLPKRPADGHKGTFGTAVIAAGSSQYWGAPVLAARAAYRVGAGLVALAVPEAIRPTVAGQLPEATYPPITDQDTLGENSAHVVQKLAASKALLVGPGIGQDASDFIHLLLGHRRVANSKEFINAILNELDEAPALPPLVVDADGLNLLAQITNWPRCLPPRTILTPHPGEMARLIGIPLANMKRIDRVEAAQTWAAEWGHIVLLKGAYTIVADPGGKTHILPFANPALAVGGSGDVLSGVIVGLLAQGMEPYEAAVLGGYLHGAAGQLASESLGDAGLLAGEIADWLPQVRHHLLTARPSL